MRQIIQPSDTGLRGKAPDIGLHAGGWLVLNGEKWLGSLNLGPDLLKNRIDLLGSRDQAMPLLKLIVQPYFFCEILKIHVISRG